MKWFQHDADAVEDAKLVDLALEYGAEGIGVYWTVVEKIAKKLTINNLTFELEESTKHLAKTLNTPSERIDAVLKFCIEPLGLFDLGPNKRLRCLTLFRKLDNATGKNPEMKRLATEASKFVAKYGGSTKLVRSNFPHQPTNQKDQEEEPTYGRGGEDGRFNINSEIEKLEKALTNPFNSETVNDSYREKLNKLKEKQGAA